MILRYISSTPYVVCGWSTVRLCAGDTVRACTSAAANWLGTAHLVGTVVPNVSSRKVSGGSKTTSGAAIATGSHHTRRVTSSAMGVRAQLRKQQAPTAPRNDLSPLIIAHEVAALGDSEAAAPGDGEAVEFTACFCLFRYAFEGGGREGGGVFSRSGADMLGTAGALPSFARGKVGGDRA